MSLDEVAEDVGTTRTKLDPRSSKSRLLECSKCHEPVASSAWSGPATLRCGYCSFEDERELVLERAATRFARPYRDKEPTRVRETKLSLNLADLLDGRTITDFDIADLRASRELSPIPAIDRADLEWPTVWMTYWWARRMGMAGDTLRARVTLETTLEGIATPAYRAILLANLAQHAAAIGATALAKKWLAACPDVAIAEVESEVRVARVMIAFSKGRFADVRRMTGDTLAGAGFAGAASHLAIGLNIAAHERLAEASLANAIWRDLIRKKFAPTILTVMQAYAIQSAEITRVLRAMRMKAAIGYAVFTFGVFKFVGSSLNRDLDIALKASLMGAGIAAVVAWFTFLRRRQIADQRPWLFGLLTASGLVVAGATVMLFFVPAQAKAPEPAAPHVAPSASVPLGLRRVMHGLPRKDGTIELAPDERTPYLEEEEPKGDDP